MSLRTSPLPRFRAHARARALAPAATLIAAALLLASCGGSSKGLIPLADAGPLKSDFEEVSQAARSGNGDCRATSVAIAKTEHDFAALPGTLDAGLRKTLSQGIENLRERALGLCAQPLTQTTATSTTNTPARAHLAPTTAPTTTTPATTTPAATQRTTPTTGPPATQAPNNGGGTAAPSGPTDEGAPGSGHETENTESESAGERAGGQEAGK